MSACTCGVAVAVSASRRSAPQLVRARDDLQVVGPERVTPCRDAVRLVDREDRQLDLREEPQEALVGEALGRDVEQLQLARRAADPARRASRRARATSRAAPPATPRSGQRVDLILHERDQRRDDETGALEHDRGQLVAEALAAAGREHRERGAPGEQRLDDLALPGPVVGEPEDVAKGLVGAWLQLGDRHGATVAVLRARDGACVCRKGNFCALVQRLAIR